LRESHLLHSITISQRKNENENEYESEKSRQHYGQGFMLLILKSVCLLMLSDFANI